MKSLRTLQLNMLGHPIERVEERDELGLTNVSWYEVLAPDSGAVLGSFPGLQDAEWYVLSRELRSVHRRAGPLQQPPVLG